jgi:phage FluMu gp28-like protein
VLFRSDALDQGLYRRICLTRGKPWSAEAEATWKAEILSIYRDNADEELNVIPSPSTGAYLPGPLLDARSVDGVPVLRYTAPAGLAMWAEHLRQAEMRDWLDQVVVPVLTALDPREHLVFGGDFGRVRDLTVWWFLAIDPAMRRITRLVIELRDVPFEQQKQALFFILDRVRLLGGKMDAGGNGAFLAEVAQQRYGSRIEPVLFTEGWYRDEMPPFKAAIEDGQKTFSGLPSSPMPGPFRTALIFSPRAASIG